MEICNGPYTVYAHINKANGKIYIGVTRQKPEDRWENGYGYKYNTHFWRAIEKYGWDGFDHEIIASHLTETEACNMEKFLIKELDATNQDKGYNQHEGGGLPPVMYGKDNPFYNNHSQSGENHPFYGKHHTDETRRKMSENHWDSSGANHPFYGKHPFAKGEHPNCKKVICVETGIVYDAILYAAQAVGVSRLCIRRAMRSSNYTSGGYHWKPYSETV